MRHNQIRILHGGLDEIDVGLPNEPVVGFENALYVSSTLHNVSGDSSEQPDVGVGIHEYFQVHQIPELFVQQHEDSFKQN